MKIKNILIGWGKKLGFLPTSMSEAKLSELRMKQCGKCPDAKTSRFLELSNGHAEYVHTLYCTRCKCPCLQKSLVVNEACPNGTW